MTAKIKLSELEEKAKVATPGPWGFERIAHNDGEFSYERNDDHALIAIREMNYEQPMKAKFDSAHIQAANPETVMRLCAALREMRFILNTVELGHLPNGDYVDGSTCEYIHEALTRIRQEIDFT